MCRSPNFQMFYIHVRRYLLYIHVRRYLLRISRSPGVERTAPDATTYDSYKKKSSRAANYGKKGIFILKKPQPNPKLNMES